MKKLLWQFHCFFAQTPISQFLEIRLFYHLENICALYCRVQCVVCCWRWATVVFQGWLTWSRFYGFHHKVLLQLILCIVPISMSRFGAFIQHWKGIVDIRKANAWTISNLDLKSNSFSSEFKNQSFRSTWNKEELRDSWRIDQDQVHTHKLIIFSLKSSSNLLIAVKFEPNRTHLHFSELS